MIALSPPTVIPKTRTRQIGDDILHSERLQVELPRQSLADVQWMLRSIASIDTGDQIKLGNPPQAIVVDNRPGRAFDDAQRIIVVFFGVKFAQFAMRMVEQELRKNILRATTARTGRLSNVSSTWQWKYRVGGTSQIVTAGTEIPPFKRGTVLVLEPIDVPYATRVNSLILGAGLTSKGTVRRATAKAAILKRATRKKPAQPIGFLGATVAALRGRPEFKQFAITVSFTQQYRVPGEVSRKQGTGSIVIQMKRR